ncbi:DUF4199 domain-containing protein [Flavobacterium cerinum]|uniref:DUF4199 domain-containing protein n=1 Tax=Flavobacterium cerinum TaxID=2502784 RepID=A0ABY5IP51_9FLAO|nr:DUF4199 domain-containing protein [Flavobacterium cerinum]UUC44051.1 DUF4199 domain-containing protein [Flavobacterium cerinum]
MGKYKIEIKWAFIFIIMSLLWMVLEKLCGLHSTHIDKQQYLTMLFMIPAIWVYVLALKDKKKKDYGGIMSFKQGVISGLIITLIVALFSPLTQWIISCIITPEYFPNVIEYSLKTGYHKTRAEAEAYFSLENYMKQSVIGALMMGLITTLIVAFFVRTGKPKD